MNTALAPTNMSPRDIRNHLSEVARVRELEFNALDDNASRLEEGRSILMAEMKINLVSSGACKSLTSAEDHARSSDQWKGYVRKMHDARRAANDAKAEWRKAERDYYSASADDKRETSEMRRFR